MNYNSTQKSFSIGEIGCEILNGRQIFFEPRNISNFYNLQIPTPDTATNLNFCCAFRSNPPCTSPNNLEQPPNNRSFHPNNLFAPAPRTPPHRPAQATARPRPAVPLTHTSTPRSDSAAPP